MRIFSSNDDVYLHVHVVREIMYGELQRIGDLLLALSCIMYSKKWFVKRNSVKATAESVFI